MSVLDDELQQARLLRQVRDNFKPRPGEIVAVEDGMVVVRNAAGQPVAFFGLDVLEDLVRES